MPHRPPTTFVRALGVAVLAAAAFPGFAAADAPTTPNPVPATTPPTQIGPDVALTTIQFPADATYYSDLQVFSRQPYLSVAGDLLWLYSRQRTSDDARALGTATAALAASSSEPLNGANLAGSTGLRGLVAFRPGYDDFTRAALAARTRDLQAIDGGNWFVDSSLTPRPARSRLVQFDDEPKVAARITAPKRDTLLGAVSTSRGIRLLAFEAATSKKRSIAWPVVIDGRHVTRQRYITNVQGAAALPDGSLLLTGRSATTTLPDPVLKVTPSGHVSRLADRREPSATATTGHIGFVNTNVGVAMDEQTAPGNANAVKDAIVLRGAKGQVTARRLIKDIDYPRPAGCTAPGGSEQLLSLSVGPDGLPVARIVCTEPWTYYQSDYYPPYARHAYPSFRDTQVAMVGLNADLSPKWWRPASEVPLAPVDTAPYYQRLTLCGSDTTGPDGHIDVLDCNGRITSIAVPNAIVARGKVKRSRKAGTSQAVTRIVCNGAYGSVCSGTAQVIAHGEVIGTAPYVLPGRPGAAAASIDRHITTTGALPKSFSVKLVAST